MKLQRGSQDGFTALEALLSLVMLSTILFGFVALTQRAQATQTEIQRVFTEEIAFYNALEDIRFELERSGFVDAGGDYPLIYPEGTLAAHDDAFAADLPYAHKDGAPTSKDIVFLVAQDADGDGWPDHNGGTDLSWSPLEAAYLLAPDGNGSNRLERRLSDGSTTEMLAGVTRAIFDDPNSSGFAVPLGCIRLDVELTAERAGQEVRTLQRELTVRLRNGGL